MDELCPHQISSKVICAPHSADFRRTLSGPITCSRFRPSRGPAYVSRSPSLGLVVDNRARGKALRTPPASGLTCASIAVAHDAESLSPPSGPRSSLSAASPEVPFPRHLTRTLGDL